MLYWKYSANRIFFINEYWILIPIGVFGNYLIIRKIRSRKKYLKQLEQLKQKLEKEKKIRQILALAFAANGLSYILMRGGSDVINVDYISDRCTIEEGVRFLDNERLRKIIHDIYRYKRRGKIIYITATAFCHIANKYGTTFLDLPFAVGDFGLTNVYQTTRKIFVTILLSTVGPLFVAGGGYLQILALLFGTVGLRLAFTNLDFIPTSPIFELDSTKDLKPRMPKVPDVVILNSRNKITMTQEKGQCWLADQALFNPDCEVKLTEIPKAIDFVGDLEYDDVVNMQDVTGLDQNQFTDIADLGKNKPRIPKPQKGKMVNFLDKFRDSKEVIENSETWETSESIVPERRYLRIRGRDKL